MISKMGTLEDINKQKRHLEREALSDPFYQVIIKYPLCLHVKHPALCTMQEESVSRWIKPKSY